MTKLTAHLVRGATAAVLIAWAVVFGQTQPALAVAAGLIFSIASLRLAGGGRDARLSCLLDAGPLRQGDTAVVIDDTVRHYAEHPSDPS